MTRLSSIVVGAGIALASITLAHADPVTGAWKLSVGVNDDPCTVTLTADSAADAGSASSAGDCNGLYVSRWKTSGTGLQLLSGSGELVAWLHPKEGAFQGKRVADGRLVALSR